MPEGHTTHRLAQRHQQCYGGSPVAVSSPQGRFASAAAVLDGRVLHCAEALGKHLFHVYAPDLVVHVHLSLYGAFTEEALPVQPPRVRCGCVWSVLPTGLICAVRRCAS